MLRPSLSLLLATVLVAGCGTAPVDTSGSGDGDAGSSPTQPTDGTAEPATTETEGVHTASSPSPAPVLATEPPPWLGTRVLPEGDHGFGEVVPTPPELRDRRIRTLDLLPPPQDGFEVTVSAVPSHVLERSTWSEECPVSSSDLRYVTVSHRGFDGRPHTGELLLHHEVVVDVTDVLRRAWEKGFPIEEMRIVSPADLEAPPTGDGNNTTAFVCRPVRGSQRWSQHAYGRAIDINPFHNPYVKGELVLPELASAYADRDWKRPGMLFRGDPVVTAFLDAGWDWGGDWRNPIDWMHFSRDGG